MAATRFFRVDARRIRFPPLFPLLPHLGLRLLDGRVDVAGRRPGDDGGAGGDRGAEGEHCGGGGRGKNRAAEAKRE